MTYFFLLPFDCRVITYNDFLTMQSELYQNHNCNSKITLLEESKEVKGEVELFFRIVNFFEIRIVDNHH